ncbi:RNA-binding protein [Pimephales promelas]|nr:RNA-binding protein [Pimephales promelas]KAG1929454.1 RNA-binding protein [Pimephales promelas]
MPAVTLFVRRLPETATNDRLSAVFSEIGPLKNCFVVSDRETKKCRGFGYVTFSMEEDAQRAIKEVKEYEKQNIFVTLAKRKPDDKKKKKKVKIEEDSEDTEKPEKSAETKSPEKFTGIKKTKLKARLIIRNLSFKCEEDDLKQIFSKFGTVLETKIPLKSDGKKRGFAFVQFKNMSEAGKALAAMNLKEIKDRQVAVDWAVPKDKYLATQSALAPGTIKEENEDFEIAGTDGNECAKKKSVSLEEKDDSESEEEDVSEDDDNAENESQQTDSDAREPKDDDDDDDNDDDDNDDDDDDDDDDDGDDTDGDYEEDNKGKALPKKKRDPLSSDVIEGRTIFIRNLSFDTEEEGLEEVLLQFGELKYVRVVMNSDTGHSKGCAFAQYKSKEAAEKCIAAAQDDKEFGGIRVDGRKLNILPAVNREDAAKLKDKKVKTHTGTRNLYLAREGLIRPGSKAAEGISEGDMAKRKRFDEMKRAKLRDVHVYVSKTRLRVHNLPLSVNQPKFRKLCLSAAGGKGVRITECRVMYDKKPIRGQVMGKSLGYGFVEFIEHEQALQALRHLNNNPDIFGPQKRPIVEFSLEDGKKLKLKALRLKNSKIPKQDRSQTKGQPQHPSGKMKGPLRKGNAANVDKQGKAQESQYSGFMTKPEVEHVQTKDGKKRQKVLHMPSHRGPKIRQRDKGKQPMVQPKTQKKGPSRKDRKMSTFIDKRSINVKQASQRVNAHFPLISPTITYLF